MCVKIKKRINAKKVIFGILQNVAAEMVKLCWYAISFGDLVVTCDEIIEKTKTIDSIDSFYINLTKHRRNQKYLLPYHDTIKLKETEITNIL